LGGCKFSLGGGAAHTMPKVVRANVKQPALLQLLRSKFTFYVHQTGCKIKFKTFCLDFIHAVSGFFSAE
jgi:hypothetical protein